MTHKDDNKASREDDVRSESDANSQAVSTHVGRNNVAIDVPALKHLVDTVKAKLKP
jgi:hypothetical protein